MVDGRGNHAVIIERGLTTFTREYYLLVNGTPKKLSLPGKAQVNSGL